MDNRSEVRDFLASRRARLTPKQAGLPCTGRTGACPGLRRDEVAVLAGISVEYYTRLERGNLSGVSEGVLDALAGALQLDDAERSHLFDLARTANTSTTKRRRPAAQRIRPNVQRVLDAMVGAPAWVRNGRSDFLAAQPPRASPSTRPYSKIRSDRQTPLGSPSSTPTHAEFYVDWERIANDVVGILRAEAGRNPYDRGLTDLIGELSTRSEEFRTRWAAHNVRSHRTGAKKLHHPAVGDLDLTYEAMELPADPGLTLLVYTAEPGSTTQDSLNLLATWSATLDQPDESQAVRVPEAPGSS